MPVKINDATINRPEGSRIIDAPAVMIDLPKYIRQLKDEHAWEKNDRNGITVFKTPGHTMVLSALHAGATMEDVLVDGTLILQVIEGTVSLTTEDDNTVELKEQQVLVLTQQLKQNITATTDSVLLISSLLRTEE
jgi:hypothetical protein